MTSLATTKREAVATALRTGISSASGRWVVYPSPADVISLPAVVMGPDDPYRAPLSFGQDTEEMRLVVHLFVNRAAGTLALDQFDEALDACKTAILTVSYSTSWSAMRLLGEVLIQEQPALGATFQLSVL